MYLKTFCRSVGPRRGAIASSALLALALLLAPCAMAPASAGEVARPSLAAHVLAARKAAWGRRGGIRKRVLGGETSSAGDWPWQVALLESETLKRYDASTSGEVRRHAAMLAQFCGGTLIAPNWVLTAGHCVEGREPTELMVLVGTNSLLSGERKAVKKIVIHPSYVFPNNDLAMLQIESPAITPNSTSAKAVRLATSALESAQAPPGTDAIVTGWGLTGFGQQPTILMQSAVKVYDRAACNANYLTQYRKSNTETLKSYLDDIKNLVGLSKEVVSDLTQIILDKATGPYSENLVCAGSRSGEQDSCNGDSGGPLVVKAGDGSYVQIGIVSGGFSAPDPNSHDKPVSCGAAGTFAYYTRVSRYTKWINENMK